MKTLQELKNELEIKHPSAEITETEELWLIDMKVFSEPSMFKKEDFTLEEAVRYCLDDSNWTSY